MKKVDSPADCWPDRASMSPESFLPIDRNCLKSVADMMHAKPSCCGTATCCNGDAKYFKPKVVGCALVDSALRAAPEILMVGLGSLGGGAPLRILADAHICPPQGSLGAKQRAALAPRSFHCPGRMLLLPTGHTLLDHALAPRLRSTSSQTWLSQGRRFSARPCRLGAPRPPVSWPHAAAPVETRSGSSWLFSCRFV